jgi:NMD protein affecting ribosome stability and mRNA decay
MLVLQIVNIPWRKEIRVCELCNWYSTSGAWNQYKNANWLQDYGVIKD